MTTTLTQVRIYLTGMLLTVFFYLLWDGRRLDNYGNSWVEHHVVLALSVIAGVALRFYIHHAGEERGGRVARLVLLLAVLFVFIQEVTAACLIVLITGPQRLLSTAREFIQRVDVLLPAGIAILLVAAATPHPFFVSMMLVGTAVWLASSSKEHDREPQRQRMWYVFNIFLWLALSLYYLIGQSLNRLPDCVSDNICGGYPLPFLQNRCKITCLLSLNLSQDFLYDIAIVVFAVTLVRAVELVMGTVQSVWQRFHPVGPNSS